MRIECDIAGLDPQPALLFLFFDSVMRDAAKRIALDPDAVDRVIVVSPDRFGKAVDAVRPGEMYTNTINAVAVGKTIARRSAGRIVSDIVLQHWLFEFIGQALTVFQSCSDWNIYQQQALYIVSHELGHALDHALRNDDSEVNDPRSRPFSIKETAHYYGNVVLTEYAACRNSSPVMTDALFGHELYEATKRMSVCRRQANYFLANPDDLTPRALAHTACQDAWFIIAELAKLYGHAKGNAERDASVSTKESSLLQHSLLGAALTQIGDSYPNWDVPNIVAKLTTIWHRYSETANVRFSPQDSESDLMVPI